MSRDLPDDCASDQTVIAAKRYPGRPAIYKVRILVFQSVYNTPQSNLEASPLPDYYALFGITSSASLSTIKTAYHQALLRFHPDKQLEQTSKLPSTSEEDSITPANVDIGFIKDAYHTLSTPALRARYDATLYQQRCTNTGKKGPRPAQVISLEDFVENEGVIMVWSHACRCGGEYRIGEAEMERGQHLVGCVSCSEVIWVGYEVVEAEGGEEKTG